MERKFDWRTRVIAVDFDGCLSISEYPEKPKPNWPVIREAIRLQKAGACLILWTSRTGEDLQIAVEFCRSWGLEFDYINKNPPFRIDLFGGSDPRKIGADEYWGDRAVWMGAPGVFRNIRGATVKMYRREDMRAFIDNALRPEIAEQGEAGVYPCLLLECLERLEFLIALIDEQNAIQRQHYFSKGGGTDASQ